MWRKVDIILTKKLNGLICSVAYVVSRTMYHFMYKQAYAYEKSAMALFTAIATVSLANILAWLFNKYIYLEVRE